jgi:hypothetical protein
MKNRQHFIELKSKGKPVEIPTKIKPIRYQPKPNWIEFNELIGAY